MPIDNLNAGLLNGISGSYGTPKVTVSPYPVNLLQNRKRKAIAFSDFWGSYGDFRTANSLPCNDLTTLSVDILDKESLAGGVWLASSSVATVSIGILKGTSAGAYGGASMIRPFIFEISYNNSDTSNATNNYTVYVSLDNQLGTYPTHSNFNGSGIWFEYNHAVNNGKWQVKASLFDAAYNYVNETYNTNFDFNITQSDKNYFRKLRFEKTIFGDTTGVVRAYIDDIVVAEIPVSPDRFIYSGHAEARVILRKTASSGVTNRLIVDYMYYEMTLPNEISGIPK